MKNPLAGRSIAATLSAAVTLTLTVIMCGPPAFADEFGGGPVTFDLNPDVENPALLLPGAGRPRFYKMEGTGNIPAAPELAIADYRVEHGDTVWGVLHDGGFQPNSDLMGVVKALNASHPDLNRLSPGEVLQMPRVMKLEPHSERFVLVDDAVRQDFNAVLDDFDEVTMPAASRLPSEIRDQLMRANAALKDIGNTKDELPGDVLHVAQAHAATVRRLVDPRGSVVDGLSVDRQKLELTVSGIEAIAKRVNSNQQHHYQLVVHTLNRESNKPVCGVRVYWMQEFFYSLDMEPERRRLYTFSSPARGTAQASILRIWGEWGDERVSEPEYVDLTQGDVEYQLHVRAGAECQ